MNVRKLKTRDAPYMLEWMHDDSVVHFFRKSFADKTIGDCVRFIKQAEDESDSINLAIVDERDEYYGTVSLKHIQHRTAELGIVVRRCAMGRGYAAFGLKEIFAYGHRNREIDFVYWCVDPENKRAIRFYDKNHFQRCDAPDMARGYAAEEKQRLCWYCYQL